MKLRQHRWQSGLGQTNWNTRGATTRNKRVRSEGRLYSPITLGDKNTCTQCLLPPIPGVLHQGNRDPVLEGVPGTVAGAVGALAVIVPDLIPPQPIRFLHIMNGSFRRYRVSTYAWSEMDLKNVPMLELRRLPNWRWSLGISLASSYHLSVVQRELLLRRLMPPMEEKVKRGRLRVLRGS